MATRNRVFPQFRYAFPLEAHLASTLLSLGIGLKYTFFLPDGFNQGFYLPRFWSASTLFIDLLLFTSNG